MNTTESIDISEFKQSINIDQIISIIELGKESIEQAKGKCILLVLGTTGSGKSTFSNYLNEKKIENINIKKEVEMYGMMISTNENQMIVARGEEEDFQIGHSKTSQTLYVQAKQLNGDKNYVLCDFPGFFDNRSVEHEIAHSIYLKQFLSKCSSVKPIILLNFKDFEAERGISFKKLYTLIRRMLKNPDKENFSKCLFLYTHAKKAEVEDINGHIVSEKNSLDGNENDDQLLFNLLQQIEKHGDLVILNPPKQQFRDHINLIKSYQPFLNPEEEFNQSLSYEANQSVILYAKNLQQQITQWILLQSYEKIFTLLNSYKKFAELLGDEFIESSYQNVIHQIKINIENCVQKVIKDFSDTAETEVVFLCKKIVDDIVRTKEILHVIDQHRGQFLEEFKISEAYFIKEVMCICNQISQNCISAFSTDIQIVKDNLQKLQTISLNIVEISTIYNDCKYQLNQIFNQQFEKLQKRIQEQFESENDSRNNSEGEDDMDGIEHLIVGLHQFKQINNFLRPFYQQDQLKMDMYDDLIKLIQNNFKQMVSNVKLVIGQKSDKFYQHRQESTIEQFEFSLVQPVINIKFLRQLSATHSFNEYVNVNEYYEQAKKMIRDYIIQTFQEIKSALEENKKLTQIEGLLISLDQVRNLDEAIKHSTTHEHQLLQDQIIKRILLERDMAEDILDNCSSQLEENNDFDKDVFRPICLKEQKKDFRKLVQVIDFLKNMSWTDNYYKKSVVSQMMTKSKEILTKYLNHSINQCQSCVEDYKFKELAYFISIMNNLKEFSDIIPQYQKEKEECIKKISQQIGQTIEIKEKQFNEISEKLIEKRIVEVWKNIDQSLSLLIQIEQLKGIPYIKELNKNLINKITIFLQNYYEENIINIKQNKTIKEISNLKQQNLLIKQRIFIENIEIISEYENLNNLLGKNNNFSSIRDQVVLVYDHIIIEYQDNLIKNVNPQQQKNEYEYIKEYTNQFKTINTFSLLFESFKTIPNPQQQINSDLLRVLQLIKKNDFTNIKESLDPLLTLSREEDKLQLGSIFQQLYNKIQEFLSKIEDQIHHFKKLIDQDFNKMIKENLDILNEITSIYTKYAQYFESIENSIIKNEKNVDPLFSQSKDKILEFIQIQTSFIKQKASIQSFIQMEESYDQLDKFVWYLQKNSNQRYNIVSPLQQLKSDIEQIIQNLFSDAQILSQPANVFQLLSDLQTSYDRGNQTFSPLYQNGIKQIPEKISQYLKSQFQIIAQNLELENDIQKQQECKQQLFKLKNYLEYLKENDLSYVYELIILFNELEEKLLIINQKRYKEIEMMINKGDSELLKSKLISQKLNDKEQFGRTYSSLKDKFQNIVKNISNFIFNTEEEFTDVVRRLYSIKNAFSEESEEGIYINELYQQLILTIVKQSGQLLTKIKQIIESSTRVQVKQNIVDLFKLFQFLKILNSQFQDEKIKQQIIQVEAVKKKLKNYLIELKDQQNLFIQTNGQSSSYLDLQAKFTNFGPFINFLKQGKDLKLIDKDIIEIGTQIDTVEKLVNQIELQFKNSEKDLDTAWENDNYEQIKYIIEELIQKRKQFNSFPSEILNIDRIINKVEDNIDLMTKEALKIIKSTRKYDEKFNLLINKIYKAEECLFEQIHLQYKSQSQIELIEKQLNHKIDEIKSKYPMKDYHTIHSIKQVSKILIKIQLIGDNVKQFSKIVVKKITQALENMANVCGNDGIIDLAKQLQDGKNKQIGVYIVQNYKIFKFYKIRQFYQAQLQHNDEYAFNNLKISKTGEQISPLNPTIVNTLKGYLTIYKNVYKNTIDKFSIADQRSLEQIIKQALEKIGVNKINLKNWNKQTKEIASEVLALICAYWSLSDGTMKVKDNKLQRETYIYKSPTIIQIVSIMMLLGFDSEEKFIGSSSFINKVIEILTGEGKSLTLGFCSILLALLGCHVDVACYSTYLSQRDWNDFQYLFTKFGVLEKINYGTFKDLSERYINQYGNVRNLTNAAVVEKQLQKNKEVNLYQNRILLIDEVDVFFDLEFYGQTYNPIVGFSNEEIVEIIYYIWQNKNLPQNQIQKQVLEKQTYKKLINDYPEIEKYIQKQVELLTFSIKNVKNHEEKKKYIAKNDRIGYLQKDSSYNFDIKISYDTLFAYFNKYQQKQITEKALQAQIEFSLDCGNLSYALIPKQYQNIIGVTGTLQSLNKAIKDALKILEINCEIYAPSMYNTQNRKFNVGANVSVEVDIDNQYLKINEITQKSIERNQCVLIFFKSKKHLSKYKNNNNFLKNTNSQIIELTDGMDSSDIDYYVKKSTESKSISLCMREYGRGTDFICYDPEVTNNGGVVIIQAFLSEDQTEEIQIQGRTARQGQKGEYYLILNEKDLEKKYGIKAQQIQQWRNSQESKELYENIAFTRDKIQNLKYEQLKKSVERAKEQHTKTIKFYNNLHSGEMKKIFEYINQQDSGND